MRTPVYSVHPGIAMVQRAIADLPAKAADGRGETGDLMRWLDRAHEMDR
jgi:hypothetical protein